MERCHLLRTRRSRKNAAAKAFQFAWWHLRPLRPPPSAEDEGWRVRRAEREAEERRRRYEEAMAAKKAAVAAAKAAKAAAKAAAEVVRSGWFVDVSHVAEGGFHDPPAAASRACAGRRRRSGGGDEMAALKAEEERILAELAALEAIYAESDEYVLADDADIDGLRERIEQWQGDGEGGVGDDLVSSIVQHPPTRFWLQLVVEDETNAMGTEQGVDLVATVLLQVMLSPSYPEASVPTMEVAYFCATDRNAQMSVDKALESLVHLEEDRLLQALTEQAQQVVPMPCVYEVAATWLPDHLFEYCKLRTHAQL